MERENKIERSYLWEQIYNVVKKIHRENVEGDALDAPSAATEIEQILLNLQNKEACTLFNPKTGTSSATICFNCGKEKFIYK